MSNILEQIIATKHEELAARQSRLSLNDLKAIVSDSDAACRGFVRRLQEQANHGRPGIIAEIKKASPSKGVIRSDFDPVAIALDYVKAGASCLSILTDEQYFQGCDDYLRSVRSQVELPIIRKDFTIEAYQVYEAKAMGADCVLLIVSALKTNELAELHELATSLGMDALIEVHDKAELEIALQLSPQLVGINNRNLKTFRTSLDTTIELLEFIPSDVTVVTESGIASRADVEQMQAQKVHCFLVGEAFMRQPQPGQGLRELFFPNPG